MSSPDEIDEQAKKLAREGVGWEDLCVRLGISKRHARVVVFGKMAARKMELRDALRSREREVA